MGKRDFNRITGDKLVLPVKDDGSQLKHLIRNIEGTQSAMAMLGMKVPILKYLKELRENGR